MIVKVWGHANGTEILFENVEGDLWTTAVPATKDGRYVVDVYAENDYGIQAYVATVLFIYSGHKFTMKVLQKGYSANAEMDAFISKFVSQIYAVSGAETSKYTGDVSTKEKVGTEQKGGYIGEYQVCS